MYRVAIIVNENETLHSVYANAEETIKKALTLIYSNNVDDFYSFKVFDKFNIFSLFEKGEDHLNSFDSVFVATNACNNKEIADELYKHADDISLFLDDGHGCNHGLFVSNQQKMGGNYKEAKSINFLPQEFSYKLIKREEKKSSDGKVSIMNRADVLTSFPKKITEAMIERACSGQYNQFMPHKYRFYLVPEYDSTYEVIYCDKSYNKGGTGDNRLLLLKSRLGSERIVISSMVLDWAEHLDQLANIIVYITEGTNQIAFVSKSSNANKSFVKYIKKARDYKLAVKTYDEHEINSVLRHLTKAQESSAESSKLFFPHRTFVFYADWGKDEVEALWNKYASCSGRDVIFYRMVTDLSRNKGELVLESSFSKSIRNSQMFLCAEEWLNASFVTSKWRKSIWTYEYVLSLLSSMNYKHYSFAEPLYQEIRSHFKITNGKGDNVAKVMGETCNHKKLFEKVEFQTYDNVFNSTCSCCVVLAKLYEICTTNKLNELKIGNDVFKTDTLYQEMIRFGNWITYKLDCKEYHKRISWQDNVMAFVSLFESGYFNYLLKEENTKRHDLIMELAYKEYISVRNALYIELNGQKMLNDKISNPDLCKAIKFYYTLMRLGIYKKEEIEGEYKIIEDALSRRQKYNGCWKNLSETAEVSLALLEGRIDEPSLEPSLEYEVMINRAINYIQNEYSVTNRSWLNDENTTAKALHVILKYDELFNFAFDDFIVDLISSSYKYSQSNNVNNNIKALDTAQARNNELQVRIEGKTEEIKKKEVKINYSGKLIKRYKLIVGFLSTAFAVSILFIACIFGIMATKYYDTLSEIMEENTAVVISTALGIVVTTILTGIVEYSKTKLIEEYDRKDGKE